MSFFHATFSSLSRYVRAFCGHAWSGLYPIFLSLSNIAFTNESASLPMVQTRRQAGKLPLVHESPTTVRAFLGAPPPACKPESTLEYYFSLEHGSETDKVPEKWRYSPKFGAFSVYGLSSFAYSLVGFLLLGLQYARPERSLYAAEPFEPVLYIWQGLISYQCDCIDLGIRSWSHPTDRISATVFTALMVVKYCFARCRGPLGVPLYLSLFVMLVVGLMCFNRSCIACREANPDAYRKWHVAWHFAFPSTMMVFYSFQYLAPLESVACTMAW